MKAKRSLNAKPIDPPQEDVNSLINLFRQGRFQDAHKISSDLIEKYSKSAALLNLHGVILKGLGQFELSLEAYKKAVKLNSGYAEAYNNMGNLLKQTRRHKEAIDAFNKALSIKPAYAEANNNLGNVFKEVGRLREAFSAYKKAVEIKPNYPDAIENISSLMTQVADANIVSQKHSHLLDKQDSKMGEHHKYHIQKAILAFLSNEPNLVSKHLANFDGLDPNLITKLPQKNQDFCFVYQRFLKCLIQFPHIFNSDRDLVDNVYHLGESHSLSFAHQIIKISGLKQKIIPRITFGAKAFHFSMTEENHYKAITKANFESLPNFSNIFLSFGEIDCRDGGGFIAASKKLNQPIETLISDTVRGYVDWFAEQNVAKNHTLFFFNVPAPNFNKTIAPEVNTQVAETVSDFNAALAKCVTLHNFNLVDVYSFTCDENGFSNEKYHIDRYHLGPQAIQVIEPQLN